MASHNRMVFSGIVVVVAAFAGSADAVAVRFGSDLNVSALSAPSRAATGSAIVVNDTTRDSGGGGADASVTGFYLSADSTLDASDIRLAPARAIGPLAAGASSAGASSVIIPDVEPGQWFLIANADDNEMVSEVAESNNLRVVSIHIYTRPITINP